MFIIRLKYPKAPDCWFKDGMTEQHWIDFVRDGVRHENKQRLRALRELFNVRRYYKDLPEIFPYLFVGFVALILGRGYRDKHRGQYDSSYCETVNWGYHNDGYFWHADCMDVSLKRWRYHIYSDGECLM